MKNKLCAILMLVLVATGWASNYKLALPGYRYQFPRDYFSHPDYQTEWWYYTGNLKSADGHRFGFELTFFRQAVARDANTSTWHMHDLYMAHLALSDITGQRFYHTQRFNRAGPGIAGVNAAKGLIWNGNWHVQFSGDNQDLRGIDPAFTIQLHLVPDKPLVIHGRDGISRKAAGAGHASHYFSFTRLLTTGSIVLNGTTYQVDGTSWMDHEFFSDSMASSETGWDWLSLQLDDNTELMLYRLRHKDGSIDPYSSGTYVDAQGRSVFLSSQDFTMTPKGETWDSTKAEYPVAWHVSIPKLHLELNIATPLRDQELANSFGPSYWEGSIDIAGQHEGRLMHGVGYLEMTGYGKDVVPR